MSFIYLSHVIHISFSFSYNLTSHLEHDINQMDVSFDDSRSNDIILVRNASQKSNDPVDTKKQLESQIFG